MTDVIFQIFTLFGGLAFFLYGMNVMSHSIEKKAGNRLKAILTNLTSNPIKGFFLGAGTTALIQSSSATTVMLVGFVSAGLMELSQTIGVIMGANFGTAVTNFLFSTIGLDTGENFFLRLLKPSGFAPILAFIGIILFVFCKKQKKKDTGLILLGFAVLMYGMEIMSDAMAPLAQSASFQRLLVLFDNPILGVLIGVAFTAIIQSSSASIGILQALTVSTVLPYTVAVPIIMGQNIGTCISAILASIGTKKDAKRVAVIHVFYNIFAMIILLAVFWIVNIVFKPAIFYARANPFGIAVANIIFKFLALIVLMPFTKYLEKFSRLFFKGKKKYERELIPLDDILLDTPVVAIEHCKIVATEMAALSVDSLKKSIKLLTKYDENIAEEIVQSETDVDQYEDKLGAYLLKLNARNMTNKDNREVTKLLHILSDFERISDHSVNIMKTATEIKEKKLDFSPEAKAEIKVICDAVNEILDITFKSFSKNDIEMAEYVEPLEQTIDKLKATLKKRHVNRLQTGKCTIELGFVFSDLLTSLERVADHCSNIASCVIEISRKSFEMHEYLHSVKYEDNPDFEKNYVSSRG
jgi:phosphate:Na+ symporter